MPPHAQTPAPSDGEPPRPPPRYRFGLGGLFLLMFVLNATFAGAFYVVRGFSGGRSDQLLAIVFTVVAPLLLTTLASIWINLARRRRSPRRKRTLHIKG